MEEVVDVGIATPAAAPLVSRVPLPLTEANGLGVDGALSSSKFLDDVTVRTCVGEGAVADLGATTTAWWRWSTGDLPGGHRNDASPAARFPPFCLALLWHAHILSQQDLYC